MFKKPAVTLLAAAMLASSALSAQAAETLNLVFLSNTNDEEYDSALVLKNYIESRSDNLKLEIFAGAQLCGAPRECFEALDAGTVDIYVATAGGVSVVYPAIAALNLPYVFDSDEVVGELMTGSYQDVLRDQIYKGTNGKFLSMALSNTGGWRHYVNAKQPAHTPADLKGMKLRTVEDHVQMEQVKLHGASPTPIPFMEVYTSLQTGVVDGTLNSITDLTNVKLHERAKYMTMDGHNYMFCNWLMSTARFKALPQADQDLLIAAFDVMGRVQNGVQMRKELDAWDVFAKEGGEIVTPTPEEKAAFVKAVEPLRDWYLKEFGDEGKSFLDALDVAVAAAQKTVDARHAAFKGLK